MIEFFGYSNLLKKRKRKKESEDSLSASGGVHKLLSWFPVSIRVSEAANQTTGPSNIFGLGSREEK